MSVHVEISHLRGRNFNQGRGLPSQWLNSDPMGENRQTHDGLFFAHFLKVCCRNIKIKKKREKLNFVLVGFTLFLSSRVFLLGIGMGVNIVTRY